ncbi:hypothetical protein Tco_0540799 [Tanacetum coccineum]
MSEMFVSADGIKSFLLAVQVAFLLIMFLLVILFIPEPTQPIPTFTQTAFSQPVFSQPIPTFTQPAVHFQQTQPTQTNQTSQQYPNNVQSQQVLTVPNSSILLTMQNFLSREGKYGYGAMKMEYWIQNADHNLWRIVQQGNSPKRLGKDAKGNTIVHPHVSLDEHVAVQRENKARFGGNEESKKMRKTMLKQQFTEFSVTEEEGYKGYGVKKLCCSHSFCFIGAASSGSKLNYSNQQSIVPPILEFWSFLQHNECVLHSFVAENEPDQDMIYEDFDQVDQVKTDKPKALVSVDSMVNWSDHAAENKTGEVEKIYGMMAGLHADTHSHFEVDCDRASCQCRLGVMDCQGHAVGLLSLARLLPGQLHMSITCAKLQPLTKRSLAYDAHTLGTGLTAIEVAPCIAGEIVISREIEAVLVVFERDDGVLLLRPQQVTLGGIKDHIFGVPRVMVDLINPHGVNCTDKNKIKGGIVKFGGGDGRISGKGTIRTSKLDFENVYYVEELQHFNLFSVSQICDKKNKVLFTDTDCLVLSEEFQLPDENLPTRTKGIVSSKSIPWLNPPDGRVRMAHVNFKTINKLAKGGLVDGLPLKVFTNEHNCVACNKGKQHKASYKHISAVRLITETLQLLHMDLFGPTNIAGTQETNINAGTQDHDSDSEVDEQVIVVPSFPSNSFAGPSSNHGPSVLERNADYAEELAKLQRQEYEARD